LSTGPAPATTPANEPPWSRLSIRTKDSRLRTAKMPPLKYHPGQVAIQEEANTVRLADNLSKWVGPVTDYAVQADLILLAHAAGQDLAFTVLSGEPPMVDVLAADRLRLNFPEGGARPQPGRVGGLV